jgi:hypothetical protein
MIELEMLDREVVEVNAIVNSDCYNSSMIVRKNSGDSDKETLYIRISR